MRSLFEILRGVSSNVRRKRIRYVAQGVLLVSLFMFPIAKFVQLLLGANNNPPLYDFGAYYQAALAPWGDLYSSNCSIPNTACRYLYPPLVLFLFYPFTLLPFYPAGILWQALSAAILWYSVFLLYGDLTDSPPKRRLLVGFLSVCSAPIVSGLVLGQVTPLLVALICLSASSALRGSSHQSGFISIFPGFIKPMYFGFGLHLFRDKQRFTGSLLSGIGLLIVSLAVFGFEPHIEYLHVLRSGKGWGEIVLPRNWTAKMYRPFYFFGKYHLIPKAGVAFLSLIAVLRTASIDTENSEIAALSVACLTVPLISPSPNSLILGSCIPGVVLLVSLEERLDQGFPSRVLLLAALIPFQPILIAGLTGYGAGLVPQLEYFSPLLPILQPAAWGAIGLYGISIYRLIGTY